MPAARGRPKSPPPSRQAEEQEALLEQWKEEKKRQLEQEMVPGLRLDVEGDLLLAEKEEKAQAAGLGVEEEDEKKGEEEPGDFDPIAYIIRELGRRVSLF